MPQISLDVVVPDHQEILKQHTDILGTLTDLSAHYIGKSKSCNFPTVTPTAGEKIAFGASFTPENFAAANDSFNLVDKQGGAFELEIHESFQEVLPEQDIKTKQLLESIGIRASNEAIVAMLAGAAVANNVTQLGGGANKVVVNLMQGKSNIRKQKTKAPLFAILNAADILALNVELIDSRRQTSDISGVVDVVAGVNVMDGSDIDAAVLANSMVYASPAYGFCWGPNYIYMETEDALATSKTFSLSRTFGGKVLQAGKYIAVIKPAGA